MPRTRRAARAAAELARINAFFPIMPLLGNRWAASRPFEGLTIGVSAHLTTLTAALVGELRLGGGHWVLCGASSATTDHGVVELLRDGGFDVYTTGSREDYHQQVLDHEPHLLADVGANLIGTLVGDRPEQAQAVLGAVEVTRNGVARIEGLNLPFPVVNINDGRLKPAIENRHGVGEGLWHAFQTLTGIHLSGRRVAVIGYGPVGRGVAAYARAAGAAVQVVELDPIRRLVAHYDGYPIPELDEALSSAGVAVTCTGHEKVLSASDLKSGRDGLILLNAGHGGDEIDTRSIRAGATGVDNVAEGVVSYQLEGGPEVVLLGDGHPLNIVLNAGSPEPVLLHFAVLGLALEWLTQTELAPGPTVVPVSLEQEAAVMAMHALGTHHR